MKTHTNRAYLPLVNTRAQNKRQQQFMTGAICGDIAGSFYEWSRTKTKDDVQIFHPDSDFTDDTVLTLAVADAILNHRSYKDTIVAYGRKYHGRGYGNRFSKFLHSTDPQPYNSFGNGSAMRVSPVGWAFDTEEEVMQQAAASAAPSHNHAEGIKGAQSVAMGIFWARTGKSKPEIRHLLTSRFGYDLNPTMERIRPVASFNETCQVSVPEAISAFLDSDNYTDAVRNAISLGADADTQAAIAGGIAEAFYGRVPETIAEKAKKYLPEEFLTLITTFYHTFINHRPWQ